MSQPKVAIVGCGAAGLSAAHVLRDHAASLTLYEKGSALGGHAATVEVNGVPVDCGFLVFNENTYPNLIGMFEELGVATEPSDMSFAVSLAKRTFEWSSVSLKGLFGSKGNAVSGDFYNMLSDMMRFNKEAPEYLKRCQAAGSDDPLNTLTMGEYLATNGYSAAFKNYYLLPQIAAVWSASANEVLKFPARTFITFSVNHSLLQVLDRPQWRTVSKRSRQYLSRIAAALNPSTTTIHLNTSVTSVQRHVDSSSPSGYRVLITDSTGRTEMFDNVIFGCHPDEALAMLGKDANAVEKGILGKFKYAPNTSYLHSDDKLMPANKACWSSWNYMGKGKQEVESDGEACCVTYWLNLLQNLPEGMPQLFITLNPSPDALPDPSKVIRTFEFAHPQYNLQAIEAQKELHETLQGLNGCFYAGAYQSYGFHEDACTSGIRAANRLTQGKARPSWWDKPLYTIPKVLLAGSGAAEAETDALQELLLKRAAGGPYWTDNLGNGGAVGRATGVIRQVLEERAKAAAKANPKESSGARLGTNSAGDIAGRVVAYPADVIYAFKALIAGSEDVPSPAGNAAADAVSLSTGTETGSEEEDVQRHHGVVRAAADQLSLESLKGSPTRSSAMGSHTASEISLATFGAANAGSPANASRKKGSAGFSSSSSSSAPLAVVASASRRQRLVRAFASMLTEDKTAASTGGEYAREVAAIEQVLGYRRAFKNEAVRKLFWGSAGTSTAGATGKSKPLGHLMEKGLGGYTVQEEPLHRPDVYPSVLSYAWHTLKGAALSTAAQPIMGFLDRAIKKGAILFRTPDGTEHIFGDPSAMAPFRARLRVHSWRFFLRVAAEADIGLARSFIAGEWTTDDLTSLFRVFVANRDDSSLSAGSLWMSKLGQTLNYLSFALTKDNDLEGARKNIHAHYDLSNDMFAAFLDSDTMMYSCALFPTERRWVKEANVVGALPNKNGLEAKPSTSTCPSTGGANRADALDMLAMQVSAVPLPVAAPSGGPAIPGLRQELVFKGSLPDAQLRKVDHLIARANVQKGDRVLDLGFGWGGLSIRLAETVGCRVHGITLSKEQHDLALERVRARGLQDLITFEIVDYREFAARNKGVFDRIISCEQIEAVGHKHFGEYMKCLDDMLAPNGVLVIQAITIPETRWEEYISSSDFINTLIFPGGCCVSLTALLDANRKAKSSLILQSTEDFSLHYAETLRRWRANFSLAFDDVIRPQGTFDDAFAKTWNYYLCYCEAGFASQTLGLHILTFARPGTSNLWVGQPSGRVTAPYGPCVNTPGDDAVVVPSGVF